VRVTLSRTQIVDEQWSSPEPEEASALLAGTSASWWFAGGWAIDLFSSGSRRPHSDLDIGCFRADLANLLDHLRGWDFQVASDGRLTPLVSGASLSPDAHGLWCRPLGSPRWVLEVLVEDGEGSDWVYRRDRRIRRPAEDVVACAKSGYRYLRPEIQLLYKSKDNRPRDDSDFRAAWPSLDAPARAWLVAQLRLTSPEHAWLAAMGNGEQANSPVLDIAPRRLGFDSTELSESIRARVSVGPSGCWASGREAG
jgi:hypothetical protein